MWNIALNTLKEIIRNKFLYLILVFAVLFLLLLRRRKDSEKSDGKALFNQSLLISNKYVYGSGILGVVVVVVVIDLESNKA